MRWRWPKVRKNSKKQEFSREQRLEARIISLEKKLELHKQEEWNAPKNILGQAREQLNQSHLEAAWRLLIEAELLELTMQDDQEKIWALAEALRIRLKHTLPDEEQKSICELINTAGEAREGDKKYWKDIVLSASKLSEERIIFSYRARERRDKSIKTTTRILLILLIVLVMTDFVYSLVHYIFDYASGLIDRDNSLITPWLFEYLLVDDGADSVDKEKLRPVLTSIIFGSLGASLSALLALGAQQRVPFEWETGLFSGVRPLIGATSGLLALIVINSSVFLSRTGATTALLAFIFGFSERVVVGALQKIGAENLIDEREQARAPQQ